MIIKEQKPTQGVPLWVFVLLGAVAAGVIGWAVTERPDVVETTPSPSMARRMIDGVWVPEGTPEAYPFAVVIENSIDAWPISGIARSNLVWEAPVEAGITRLLAIFADGKTVDEIGPVRSLRPYFIDWAEEVHALIAHVGGSPEALAQVSSRAVIDLNEFWNGAYFWRALERPPPHNVYTSTDQLQKFLGDEPKIPAYESWQYKDDELPDGRGASQKITVVFGNDSYTVTWKYDPETNEYTRWQLGEPYREASGAVVRVKNVIVMKTEVEILDEVGRRKIKTTGNGPAHVFRDGTEIIGEWRRTDRAKRTMFYDTSGVLIALNAGVTWIAVTDLAPVAK